MPTSPSELLFSGVTLACLGAAALVLALRTGLHGAWLLLVAVSPLAVLCRFDVRVFSFHGLMHASVVYRILEGGAPPDDPLLAGSPLPYPWLHHLLVAWLCRMLEVLPGTGFALLSAVALPATLWLLYRCRREDVNRDVSVWMKC